MTSTCTFRSYGAGVEVFVKWQIQSPLFDRCTIFLGLPKKLMWLVDGDVYLVCLSYRKIAADFLCGLWPCVHSSRWESTVTVVYPYCRNMSFNTLSALGHFGNHFLLMVAALFLLDLYTSWRRSIVFSWFFPCDFHACVTYVRCFRYEDQHPSAILMVNGGAPIQSSNLIINFQVALQGTFRWGHHGVKCYTKQHKQTQRFAQFLHSLNASFCFFANWNL